VATFPYPIVCRVSAASAFAARAARETPPDASPRGTWTSSDFAMQVEPAARGTSGPRRRALCLSRSLTIPAIFPLSIVVSSFSVSAALWIWFAMIAVVAAAMLRRRMAR
jgi:hypothetical protein